MEEEVEARSVGESALRTSGCIAMPADRRATAIVVNQTSMTGPNSAPDRAGAAALDGEEDDDDRDGDRDHEACPARTAIVFVPSTAESTEIAGVIMLSPKNSAAPKTPRPDEQELRARADAVADLRGSARSAP